MVKYTTIKFTILTILFIFFPVWHFIYTKYLGHWFLKLAEYWIHLESLKNTEAYIAAAAAAAAAAKLPHWCPTLCDPIDCSLPGSTVPGILQARTLE